MRPYVEVRKLYAAELNLLIENVLIKGSFGKALLHDSLTPIADSLIE